MAREAKQGDCIKTLVPIENRSAPYGKQGPPGKTTISIPEDTALTAATDELSGNIIVQTTSPAGKAVFPSLYDGEWKLVPQQLHETK